MIDVRLADSLLCGAVDALNKARENLMPVAAATIGDARANIEVAGTLINQANDNLK